MLPKILPRNDDQRRQDAYNALLREEAKYGGQLFGPIPKGRRREFFCLDEHTWVWHEEWTDAQGQRQVVMTHYHIRPDGILKSQNGHYSQPSETELRNFYRAAKIYVNRVSSSLRHRLQTA